MKKFLIFLFIFCIPVFMTTCSAHKGESSSISYTNQIVYWVPDGKVYHTHEDCQTIQHRDDVEIGTIEQAQNEGKNRECKICEKND